MRYGFSVGGMTSAMALSALVVLPAGFWVFTAARAAVAPPSLAAIQSMSDLATTRVHITDVIEGENAHWRGKWSLHGEVILGVSLGDATYGQSQPDKREAVLRLPQPHLIAVKVDHERSEEMSMKSLTYVGFSDPKLLRDDVWKHADRKLQRLGMEPGYVERAKVQAERVLQNLFNGIGWKVRFEWE